MCFFLGVLEACAQSDSASDGAVKPSRVLKVHCTYHGLRTGTIGTVSRL